VFHLMVVSCQKNTHQNHHHRKEPNTASDMTSVAFLKLESRQKSVIFCGFNRDTSKKEYFLKIWEEGHDPPPVGTYIYMYKHTD